MVQSEDLGFGFRVYSLGFMGSLTGHSCRKDYSLWAIYWAMLGNPDPLTVPYPRPPKESQNGTPKMTPITTLRKLEDFWEVPFFGFFRGSGILQV